MGPARPSAVLNPLRYQHGDHLGSVAAATTASGGVLSHQEFDPWGAVRAGTGVSQTSLNYTGQRKDDTGLLYYHARYYDPALARWISPDSIVPGAAMGSGGALGTLGQDQQTELRALTVDFHEPGLEAGLGGEDRFTQQQGFWFQLSDRDRQQAAAPWGPSNPQALNRYSYVLENPLRYTDPTGHLLRVTADRYASLLTLLSDALHRLQAYTAAQGGVVGAGLGVFGIATAAIFAGIAATAAALFGATAVTAFFATLVNLATQGNGIAELQWMIGILREAERTNAAFVDFWFVNVADADGVHLPPYLLKAYISGELTNQTLSVSSDFFYRMYGSIGSRQPR